MNMFALSQIIAYFVNMMMKLSGISVFTITLGLLLLSTESISESSSRQKRGLASLPSSNTINTEPLEKLNIKSAVSPKSKQSFNHESAQNAANHFEALGIKKHDIKNEKLSKYLRQFPNKDPYLKKNSAGSLEEGQGIDE